MADTLAPYPTAEAAISAHSGSHAAQATLLVCLDTAYTSASNDQLAPVLTQLQYALGTTFPAGSLTVAYPNADSAYSLDGPDQLRLLPYAPSGPSNSVNAPAASTWLSLATLIRAEQPTACLLLGTEAQTLDPETIHLLVEAVLQRNTDLAIPRYSLPGNQGLVNASMLSPLSRALFGARVRFPLALDMAVSPRMAERLALAAQRSSPASQSETLIWPVAEAAIAGFSIAEIGSGPRDIPTPNLDLTGILRDVAGSLFSDIEAKAAFWQRTRPVKDTLRLESAAANTPTVEPPAPDDAEIDDLLQSFRIGYNNLHDIWSLVLPPNTLVALKRLSQASRDTFTLPDTLWVRIVYDFVLAHRLRTLSRVHLLGALTPLYLAWVASHVQANKQGKITDPELLDRAFEADRPYLVSRWRWPDRFNP